MTWLLGKVVNNPFLLVWIALGSFVAGIVSGGGTAWTVQGWRLDAVQSKYDGFVATTRALGEAAQAASDKVKAEGKRKKEKADDENVATITALRADIKRMRDARSNSGFLPPASALSISPNRTCFNRTELERAIRDLDTGIQGLLDTGDLARVNLNTAKQWASD